jgi:transcriptional regulator with XRE-family HTH domain
MKGIDLKSMRTNRELSVLEVASRMGVSYQAIYKIEKGENLKVDTINKYLRAIGEGEVLLATSWQGELEAEVRKWSAEVLEYIRRVREDGYGLSREAISEKVGVSVNEILSIEKGRVVNWNTFAYYLYRIGLSLEIKRKVKNI